VRASAISKTPPAKASAQPDLRSTDGTPRPGSKQALVIEMLSREDGASLDALVKATGCAENLSDTIDLGAALNIDELRALWREPMGRPVPGALSKDLIARVLTYRLQEQPRSASAPASHVAVKVRGRARSAI
jgi:hypothetical protein